MNSQDSFSQMTDPLSMTSAVLCAADHRAKLINEKNAYAVGLGTECQHPRAWMLLWQEKLFSGPVRQMSRRTS